MKVGLISTLNSNIGDDLIREGIYFLLKNIFKTQKLEFVVINKHRPLTVYSNSNIANITKLIDVLPKGRSLATQVFSQIALKEKTFFDECDLIIQSGAPVLWPGCHRCEWAVPLWRNVVGRLFDRIPVLNLAAGSCYPWERQPLVIEDLQDASYLCEIAEYCRLTTVRDELAHNLYSKLGYNTHLIPCTAFLAANNYFQEVQDQELIMINYMAGSGHYGYNQQIDSGVWENTIRTLISRLSKRHQLAFLCHSQTEYKLAQTIDSTLPRFLPKTPQEYFSVVSKAKVGLCNRMHASIGMAGLGIPSVAVCTDTRLLMVKEVGLPSTYVKEAEVEYLEDQIENLLVHRYQEKERLLALQTKTLNQYSQSINEAVLI